MPLESATLERRHLAWIVLSGVLLFAIMCLPFFWGRVYTSDDLGAFHLPIRDFYSRQLASGQPWDWMPSLFCGFYLTGEGQLGGYHPLHLLLYRTLPMGAAFDLELLLNYPLLAVGSYLFLRRIVVRRDAAAFGALTFTFCSFNMLHFVHPNAIAIVAHLPWLLWLIESICISQCQRTRVFAACGIALLTGSQLLLGYPQYVWLSLLCEFGYAAVRLARTDAWKTRALTMIGATLVGLLIGGIQVVPTLDALQSSTRQSVSAEFRSSGSLHPFNLVQPLAPYTLKARVPGENTHELGMYFGCVPLVLCYWVWLNRKSWGKLSRVIAPTLLLTLLALLYAMGEFGPLYQLQSWLPVVRNFRFPCRAIVLVELGVAVLSAIGFWQLVRHRWPVTHEIAIPVTLSVAFAIYAPLALSSSISSAFLVATGPLLILLATWLVIKTSERAQWAPVLLILLATADLGAYGLSYAILRGTNDLNQFVARQPRPPQVRNGRIAVNTGFQDPAMRYGNQLTLAGYSLSDGYAGLEPKGSSLNSDSNWLSAAGTTWKLSNDSWQPLENSNQRFSLDSSGGRIAIERDNPGAIALATYSSVPDALTVAERFHSGWQALLDGRVVTIAPTDAGFMQCRIPAGDHQLQFRFRPESLWYGRMSTIFGLGLILSGVVFGCACQRRVATRPDRRSGRDSVVNKDQGTSSCVHQ